MKRNNFNLSHTHLFTAKMGKLIPIACEEVIPGDTFRMSSSVMVRLSPMLAPVMTPIRVRIHHWYVPYRILDDNWEEFIVDNNNTANYQLPAEAFASYLKGHLFDYLGAYCNVGAGGKFTRYLAYPAWAYIKIWNEFYRDEDLQDEVSFGDTTSDNIYNIPGAAHDLLPVAWRKDRFTTARPWTQLGEQVFVPTYTSDQTQEYTYYEIQVKSCKWVGNSDGSCSASRSNSTPWCGMNIQNAVITLPDDTVSFGKVYFQALKRLFNAKFKDYNAVLANNYQDVTLTGALTAPDYTAAGLEVPDFSNPIVPTPATFNAVLTFKPYRKTGTISNPGAITFNSAQTLNYLTRGSKYQVTGLSGVLATFSANVQSQVGSLSIRDLRLSSALQRYQENRAKWGHRYIEYLNFLGIKSSDARLQLPEYLGGGSQLLQISEVLQTSPSDDGVVGSMKGHGIGLMRSNRFTKFFEEHGVILSLMSVVPDSVYAQGTKRYFLKTQWSDFFQKDLQDIGMQEIWNGEVYSNGRQENDKDIFGYQDRYDEYRRGTSYISGDFHDTLDFWHLGRKFNATPSLNASFIECNPSMRVFADTESDPLWCFARHSIVAKRMLSKRASSKLK